MLLLIKIKITIHLCRKEKYNLIHISILKKQTYWINTSEINSFFFFFKQMVITFDSIKNYTIFTIFLLSS